MANEGSLQFSGNVTKGAIAEPFSGNFRWTVAGTRYDEGVQDIGTSDEQIVLKSDFGTPGVAVIENNDSTNYVEIGVWNGGSPLYLIKILPGESYPFRLTVAKTNIAAKANTATVQIGFKIFEA